MAYFSPAPTAGHSLHAWMLCKVCFLNILALFAAHAPFTSSRPCCRQSGLVKRAFLFLPSKESFADKNLRKSCVCVCSRREKCRSVFSIDSFQQKLSTFWNDPPSPHLCEPQLCLRVNTQYRKCLAYASTSMYSAHINRRC